MGARLLDSYRANLVPPSESVVTDQAGLRIGVLAAADAVREPLNNVPPLFHDTLIRWEDARFLAHDGVDRYRLAGAVAALLRGDPQGGSTLTMQLAKLIKKDSPSCGARWRTSRSPSRSMTGSERTRCSRSTRNQAYFGSGVYGLGQACRYYFSRENAWVSRWTRRRTSSRSCAHPPDLSRDECRARRDAVIEQLREPEPNFVCNTRFDRFARDLYLTVHRTLDHDVEGRNDLQGRYSGADIDAAKRTPLGLTRARNPSTHPFVLKTAREELQKRLGSSIYEDGLDIPLTIDSDIQRMAEHARRRAGEPAGHAGEAGGGGRRRSGRRRGRDRSAHRAPAGLRPGRRLPPARCRSRRGPSRSAHR